MKMNTKRTIAITLVFLMTASAVGALSVSAATPTKLTQLTIQATDQYPSAGESITIYGRLMNGTVAVQGASVQGQMITLNYSSDDGLTWNTLGTVAMSYYGGYSYTTTSSQLPLLTCQTEQDYYINASFAGNAQYAPSSATILIQVYPIYPDISMQVSAGPFVTNQPFTISGKITDSHTGKACPSIWIGSAAYNLDTDSFQLVGLTQANANGVYRLPAVQLPAGPWRIMLAAPGDFNHILAWNYFDITINTAPTQLSIYSGTVHPAANKAFTVYGLLTNAVTGARLPNEPPAPVDPITLTYSSDGGSTWNTLQTSVSTDGNGQYAFSVMLPAGLYQIQVHFPGDLPNYSSSDSQVLTIQVGTVA